MDATCDDAKLEPSLEIRATQIELPFGKSMPLAVNTPQGEKTIYLSFEIEVDSDGHASYVLKIQNTGGSYPPEIQEKITLERLTVQSEPLYIQLLAERIVAGEAKRKAVRFGEIVSFNQNSVKLCIYDSPIEVPIT